mgnify:CR=1 FL=1
MKREAIIREMVKGMDVLDVGSAADHGMPNYLWEELSKSCRYLTGIDPIPTDNPAIVVGNMETYQFGKRFDAIVAGDVIEHVNNPGLFLENCRKHLKAGGLLLITTPNAKWWTVFYKPHIEHVLWHDRFTLYTLLKRYGFEIIGFTFYPGNKRNEPWIWRWLHCRRAMLVVARLPQGSNQG